MLPASDGLQSCPTARSRRGIYNSGISEWLETLDAFLGIGSGQEIPKSRQDFSDRLKDRLQFAYKNAS